MSGNPFTYINSINSKDYVFNDYSDSEYNSFMINTGFSYFPDTVLLVNELQLYSGIPHKCQYDFLFHSISKKKRFSKWSKKEEKSENLQLIIEYYNFSAQKAKEALSILTEEQIDEIRLSQEKGGRN